MYASAARQVSANYRYTTHRWKLRIYKRLAVVVGWALPTINAVTLRAKGANHLSQTDRNGGQCPPYNHYYKQ